ncbi:hypothetical protein KI387_017823, partial [Taxus chinensis]
LRFRISAPPRAVFRESQALSQPINKVDCESQLPTGSSNQGLQSIIQWFCQWRIMRIPALVLLSTVASVSVLCSSAFASTDTSIKASGIGLKIAEYMRRSGWPDEVIVFVLATLPVLELRGAIPVGYWMQLQPFKTSILAILGNMVPVPFIFLYLKKLLNSVGKRSSVASNFLQIVVERTRKKAGPIEEFQWLGLMLFVAVPFPGTGAWSGAIAATILDMSFWDALSANFIGVVLAGLLVNLLVNLGIKYAIAVGVILFFVSSVMWSFLRYLRKPANNIN